MPSRPARRAILAGALGTAAAAALAACTGSGAAPGPTGAPPPGADELARREAAARELALAAQATAVAAHVLSPPGFPAAATSAALAHQAHARALLEGLPTPRATVSGGSPTGSPTGSPGLPPATTAALLAAQAAAAASHLASLDEVSGGTARLLASVGASDLALAARLRAAA